MFRSDFIPVLFLISAALTTLTKLTLSLFTVPSAAQLNTVARWLIQPSTHPSTSTPLNITCWEKRGAYLLNKLDECRLSTVTDAFEQDFQGTSPRVVDLLNVFRQESNISNKESMPFPGELTIEVHKYSAICRFYHTVSVQWRRNMKWMYVLVLCGVVLAEAHDGKIFFWTFLVNSGWHISKFTSL